MQRLCPKIADITSKSYFIFLKRLWSTDNQSLRNSILNNVQTAKLKLQAHLPRHVGCSYFAITVIGEKKFFQKTGFKTSLYFYWK